MNPSHRRRVPAWSAIAATLVGSSIGPATAPGQESEPSAVTIRIERDSSGRVARGPETSPDGSIRVVPGRFDIRLIEASTGRPIGRPMRPVGRGEVTTWAFSPDGKLFAAGNGGPRDRGGFGEDGGIRVWETDTGRVVAEQEASALVSSLSFDPGGSHLSAVVDEIDGP
jgi:hypothetical protein